MVMRVADSRYEEGEWVSDLHKVLVKEKPEIKLEPKKTALFIVDVQKGFCLPDALALQGLREKLPDNYRYFMNRLKIVVPNLQRLQDFFRRNKLEVIQCVIASRTLDGRDTDRSLGIHFPPGSQEAEVLDELKPEPNELVLTKTSSSMFAGYDTPYVLARMGIEYLVFGGTATNVCVQGTVTSAVDLFGTLKIVVVEDCCAAKSERDHVGAIRHMGSTATIASTESVINHLMQQLKASGVAAK